jgi:hypothetical protein
MPVNMTWYNDDKTIFLAEYTGAWTWQEVYEAIENANREFDTVHHRVHTIHDFTKTTHFPANVLSHAITLSRNMHPRTGIGVLVGNGSFYTTMIRIFNRVYTATFRESNFRVADSVDEAHEKLLQYMAKNDTASV